MKKSALPMPLIVGIFMVVGVFAMIAMTLLIDDEGSLFNHGTPYRARFETVEGLSPGSYVYLAGKKIGNVSRVEIEEDVGDAIVTFTLDQPYRFHSQDKLEIIQRSPITDSKRIDIVRKSGDTAPWPSDQMITGEKVSSIDFAKLSDALTTTLKKVDAKIDKLDVDAINGTFQGGKRIFDEIDNGDGNIGVAVKNIRTFTEALASSDGPVHAALTNKEWTARIDKSLANVEQFTTDLNSKDGFLHKAMVDTKFSNDLTGAIADLKKFTGESLNNDKGFMHTLFSDPKFTDDLKQTVTDIKKASSDISQFTGDLNNQDGMVHKLLVDKSWAEKLDGMLSDGHQFMADMKEVSGHVVKGEGTIGKLLTDDSLYKSIEGLVGEIRRAVDDAREFTPVSSALSAIIGVAR